MRAHIWNLALLLPLLLSASAQALDPGGEFQVTTEPGNEYRSSADMDDEGGFVVSWVSHSYQVGARLFAPDGEAQGGEFEVGQVSATYAGNTSVALDRSGFLVVWGNQPKFTGSFLLGQRLDREGHPLLSQPFSPAGAFDPDVASDPQGRSVIVGLTSAGIVATRRNASGQPVGGAIQVTDRRGQSADVTMDAAGNFVVAWNEEQGIFARRFTAAGAPRGAAFRISRDAGATSIAGNRSGRFVIAWGAGTAIRARLYSPAGQPLTPPILVSDTAIRDEAYVSAAMDAEGKVLVTWGCCYSQTSPEAIHGRWLDSSGAPSGGAFRISSEGTDATAPSAVSGPKNRFLVIWQKAGDGIPGGVPGTIFGRRLAFARPGDDPCLLRRGNFVCDTAHDGGEEELLVPFRGPGSDTPLLGDLDGDGDDDPCRYRPGRFLCDTAHDGGNPELTLAFGLPGDVPLVGDLDGEGRDDACVYRGSSFLCDTAHNGGTAEVIVSFNPFGHPLVRPFLADVDGDGDDDPCMARNGELLCDTEHDGGPEEFAVSVDFGAQGDVLLLGDVNDDRRADPCVYRGGRFLCDTRRDGSADLIIPFRGPAGTVPLLGNLDGL